MNANRTRYQKTISAWDWLWIGLGLGFLALVVGLPVINIFYQAFNKGLLAYWQGINTPQAWHAIGLTLTAVVIAVPLNTLFGISAAWVIARQQFWGRKLLLQLVDLPLTISPIIVGLMFVLLYSPLGSLFEYWVNQWNVKIIFALPGIVLVTVFVTLPFVVREVLPALQDLGREQEESAKTLGANSWQVFWQVVLPNIRWAVLYGVLLSTARALGEFGAVSVVSGKIIGETNTLTLHVERMYLEYETIAAFACASLLGLVALLTLICQELLRRFDNRIAS
ncbi:sulfate ABC transporter permease subunit CysW [Synechococcus sp. PCC 6312]|uniref:sulfate ABC transporter permease subunit CysW n=1 Tax=Synechococcus sp. (strain ATCC 27167 / PCC 6312) TaxID=195253 RepID=UPI00029F258D|nr:sulfate ABC transporter permease subunit CysW [Synechococcus sp. PCC 6312]AFY61727.1 sulfate ABC transporter, permease protein CysW [Synechococcus sp. PCC 6312]